MPKSLWRVCSLFIIYNTHRNAHVCRFICPLTTDNHQVDPYFDLYRGALVAVSPQSDLIGSLASDGPQVSHNYLFCSEPSHNRSYNTLYFNTPAHTPSHTTSSHYLPPMPPLTPSLPSYLFHHNRRATGGAWDVQSGWQCCGPSCRRPCLLVCQTSPWQFQCWTRARRTLWTLTSRTSSQAPPPFTPW